MSTQDEERRRIARDLHDSAGQNLAVLAMNLARVEDEAKRDPERLSQSFKDARELIRESDPRRYARLPIFCTRPCWTKSDFRPHLGCICRVWRSAADLVSS